MKLSKCSKQAILNFQTKFETYESECLCDFRKIQYLSESCKHRKHAALERFALKEKGSRNFIKDVETFKT